MLIKHFGNVRCCENDPTSDHLLKMVAVCMFWLTESLKLMTNVEKPQER